MNNGGIYDPVKGIFRRPSKYSLKGVSDIIGILPKSKRMICIEVKRPENKIRPMEQKAFINKINSMGGLAFFASSVEEVEKIINEFEEENKC